MTDDNTDQAVETQLRELEQKAGELLEKSYFRSAVRVNGEIARLARSHGQLLHYVYATFHRMDQSQNLLELGTTRDCAIELIAVMENEDRARVIQPDLPQEAYEHTAQWMTACLYENLAEAVGAMEGFNSEGMHQCIADGIQVCRRTGKLACVSCFREYATDVYTAADDATMAMHQCQTIANHQGAWSNRGDRRWYAAARIGWLKLLEGRVMASVESLQSALELTQAEGVPLKDEARLRAAVDLEQSLILASQPRFDWSSHQGPVAALPPKGEWPALEMRIALNDALASATSGDWPAAIATLTEWDRTLTSLDVRHGWFEVRLRLIAAMQLSGDSSRITRLADQLRERATQSADFLTLRRLDVLLDPAQPSSPIAALGPLDAGPFADPSPTVAVEPTQAAPSGTTAADADEESSADGANAADSPIAATSDDGPSEFAVSRMSRLREYFSLDMDADVERDAIVSEFLAHKPGDLTDTRDILALLHFCGAFVGCGREREIWEWAQSFQRAMPDEPSILNMVAMLGSHLRHAPDESLGEEITPEMLDKMFRLSLSMDANREGNHQRAGEYFLSIENHGEAERCLARAFRLNHANSQAAELLARVYQQTDRPRDALNVLDVCLREAGPQQSVAWEAMLLATNLGQHDAALTYLDALDQVAPETAWAHYYRAMALVNLGCGEDALAALQTEAEFMHSTSMPLDCLRTCALYDLGRSAEADQLLGRVLSTPLKDVDEMTVAGLRRLFDMLFDRLVSRSSEDPLRQRFEQTAVAAGMASENLFEASRLDDDEPVDVSYFQVLIEQPLDDNWAESTVCLSGQEHWTSYRGDYGVLASDEDHARDLVLLWQNQCASQPAEVLAIQQQDDQYRDRPGVVWQGSRWNPADEIPVDDGDDEFDEGQDDPDDSQ